MRETFFATGLVPATVADDFECSISLCAPDEPVQTPCGHVFDKPYIVKFLEQTRVNRCPLCRCVLYRVPETESIRPDAARLELVTRALRSARLPMNVRETFGFQTTPSAMASATASATSWLVSGPGSGEGNGAATVTLSYLAPRIVAMANLILAIARQHGRPYTTAESTRWSDLIGRLRVGLSSYQGDRSESSALLPMLQSVLAQSVMAEDECPDLMPFFGMDPSGSVHLSEDLTSLLTYIAFCCVKDLEEQVDRQRRAERVEVDSSARLQEAHQQPCHIM